MNLRLSCAICCGFFSLVACHNSTENTTSSSTNKTPKLTTPQTGRSIVTNANSSVSCSAALSEQITAVLAVARSVGEFCREQNKEMEAAGNFSCGANLCSESLLQKELEPGNIKASIKLDRDITVKTSGETRIPTENTNTNTQIHLSLEFSKPIGRHPRELKCVNPLNDANVREFAKVVLSSPATMQKFNEACR